MVEKQSYEELPEEIDAVGTSEREPKGNLTAPLAISATVMVIGMFLYEWLSQIIHPPVGTWESHLITIAFASLLATIVAYFVLRKQNVSLQKTNKEIAAYKQTEEALRKAHDELEGMVKERNAELVEVNKRLREEIEGRKQVEETLKKRRDSKERYQTILESIEDGYYEVDNGGNLTFFNEGLCRIAGLPRSELMGMNNGDYTTPETAKKMYQVFNKVFRTGKPAKEFDWEILRKDSTKRNVEASVSLIKDSGGQLTGFRGIVRDITERKQTEEKIRKLLYSFGKVWTRYSHF
jgi:PAS domain S-box-containing protein